MKCCILFHFYYVCDSRKKLRGKSRKRMKKMHATLKNSHKNTTVNLIDDACASDMQNIFSLDEPVDISVQRRAAQISLKHKIKCSDNKGSSNETSETQCKKCREN